MKANKQNKIFYEKLLNALQNLPLKLGLVLIVVTASKYTKLSKTILHLFRLKYSVKKEKIESLQIYCRSFCFCVNFFFARRMQCFIAYIDINLVIAFFKALSPLYQTT